LVSIFQIPIQFTQSQLRQLIKSPDTERFTFEAVLLLSLLANFHKSDAAKLNPYLVRIKETKDKDLMRKICWASNYAIDAAVKFVAFYL